MKPVNDSKSVDEYIFSFSPEKVEQLVTLRSIIKEEAQDVTEKISWGMPSFYLNGKVLMHFAVQKNHIGFYPGPSGVEKFLELSSEFKTTKGGVQLPLDKGMPFDLIREVVKFRVLENETLARSKR